MDVEFACWCRCTIEVKYTATLSRESREIFSIPAGVPQFVSIPEGFHEFRGIPVIPTPMQVSSLNFLSPSRSAPGIIHSNYFIETVHVVVELGEPKESQELNSRKPNDSQNGGRWRLGLDGRRR